MASPRIRCDDDRFMVREDEFGRAYASLTDRQRAWLKTSIARHVVWHGCGEIDGERVARHWRQGFDSLETSRAVGRVDVVVGPGFASPARLLAVILPALVAGTPDIRVFLPEDGPESQRALLVALELAGCEMVLRAPRACLEQILQSNASDPCGHRCLFLGPRAGEKSLTANKILQEGRGTLVEAVPPRVGVFCEAGQGVDIETVAWSHPDLEVDLWNGGSRSLPHGWSSRRGGWPRFLSQDYDAVFVPESRCPEALASSGLVLGPGAEGCWVHPGLGASFFRTLGVAWFGGEKFPIGRSET